MKKVALWMSASALGLSASAFAQDAPASPPEASTGLDDIIVTAQRRDESLQRAAVAVDVVRGDDLLDAGITQPERLGEVSPALTIQGTSVGNVIFVRGVGNFTLTPNSDPATAFNYDGVYLGRPTSTGGTFFDLQRVEVLKGPQGTLYGRNATAGAINVIPARPELGRFAGYGSLSYGNYDALAAEGALNLPIGANGAMRVSGSLVRRDGYLRDGTNDERTEALRVQLMSELTPRLTVRVSGDYSHNGGLGGSLSYDSFYDFTGGVYVRRRSGLPLSEGIGTPAADMYRRTLPAGPAGRTLDALDFAPHQDNRFYGAHAEINWETPIGTITVQPAGRYADLDYISTGGGFAYGQVETDEQFSLEARLTGNRIGPVDYILGGYYYQETIEQRSTTNFSASITFSDLKYRTRSLAPFARLTLHASEKLRLVGGVRYTADRKSFSGDVLTGTVVCLVTVAGARRCPTAPLFSYVADPAQIAMPFPAAGGAPVPLGASGAIAIRDDRAFGNRQSNGRVTWRGAVEYDLGSNSLAYASVETGFRSGGFSSAVGFETYDPEYITAYTIGLKNRFLDNRLQLNLELFRWNYRNQQISSVNFDMAGRTGLIIQNIGASRIQGFELSGRAAVTAGTMLSGDLQYLDTRNRAFTYQQANQGLPPLTGCPTVLAPGGAAYNVDCAGYPAFNSPRWTINLAAEQTIALGRHQLLVSAGTQYRSSRYVGFAYLDAQLVPASWQSNAQLTFKPADQHWSLSAYVRNIENNRIIAYSYTHPMARVVVNGTSAPRTYGVRAAFSF